MKRKVIQHGPSLIVSLPSKWVKEMGIVKGEELEISEQGSTLIISGDSHPRQSEVSADLTGLDRTTIMYVISGLYRLGYDKVKLTFKNEETVYQRKQKTVNVLDVIHEATSRLIGFEIMQEKEGYCEIVELQSPSEKDFDQVLRRIFLLLIEASGDLALAAKNLDERLLNTIENRHDTITKFVSYCLRLLNKNKYPEGNKIPYYFHIIASLDRITDTIKYSARNILRCKKSLDKHTLRVFEIVSADLRRYYEIFYKYDNLKIRKINEDRYAVENLIAESNFGTIDAIISIENKQILEQLLDLIEARTALQY
jgi:phosphate uptake regulator